jgi:hypothetical protein
VSKHHGETIPSEEREKLAKQLLVVTAKLLEQANSYADALEEKESTVIKQLATQTHQLIQEYSQSIKFFVDSYLSLNLQVAATHTSAKRHVDLLANVAGRIKSKIHSKDLQDRTYATYEMTFKLVSKSIDDQLTVSEGLLNLWFARTVLGFSRIRAIRLNRSWEKAANILISHAPSTAVGLVPSVGPVLSMAVDFLQEFLSSSPQEIMADQLGKWEGFNEDLHRESRIMNEFTETINQHLENLRLFHTRWEGGTSS